MVYCLFYNFRIELSTAVETIVVTFEDYYRDYVHMKSV